MADSQLILELMFLHIRGGCSLTVLPFSLMLVRTCCFILPASLCVVRPTLTSYRGIQAEAREFVSYKKTMATGNTRILYNEAVP